MTCAMMADGTSPCLVEVWQRYDGPMTPAVDRFYAW